MLRRTFIGGALAASGLVFGGLSASASAAPDAKGDPFAFVVDLTNAVLEEIRKDPKLHAADPARVRELVDRMLLPATDFAMMTRMTVGPKWRAATAEQKKRLQEGFKTLLINVYSGGMSAVSNERCELRPTRSKAVRDEMVVRTLLKSEGKPDVGIDYRIYRNKDGAWKVVDVNIEGIWMVENYRSQFAAVLSQEGVDGLIRLFEEKGGELAAKNRPAAVK